MSLVSVPAGSGPRAPAEPPSGLSALGGRGVVTVLVCGVVAILALSPLLRLAFAALAPGGELDLGLFAARIARPATLRATIHTVDTAFFGALVSLILGVPFAVAVSTTDLPGRRALSFFLILPLMIAPQVTALAWLHLFGPSSTLLAMVGLAPPIGTINPMLGHDGIVLLYGVQHAPIVFVTVRAGLAGVPRDLVEAARACGARPLRALRTVALPVVRPHLVAAFALAFVSGVGNFGIPALLGLPVAYLTLTTLIYQKISSFGPEVLPEVAALSMVIAVAAVLGGVLQSLALERRTHRLRSGQPACLPLGRFRVAAAIVAWVVIGLTLFLPALALLATSLIPAFGVPLTPSTVTLANFVEVLTRQASTMRAFSNSLLLSGAAAVLLAAFAVPLGWVLDQASPRRRALVRHAVDLPYAIPGIVLAIACILLFLKPLPLIGSLYATPWIILVAYLMRFLALAAKPVATAIAQIPRDLDEAAAACGARPLRRLASITAPLCAASAVAGAILVFMSAFNELTVSALLWSSGRETVGVVLFSLEEAGLGTQAAAIAVTALVVVVALLLGVDRLGRRLPAGVLPWR
ncbi:iron ABC transporter permease [Siculibacillus lacustris]|uniref:Iron ABC transporter permease n=1 Tax=Siculibacillus lacustris TaxID=1549641 RepID=A0A4Q9VY04_9HYPH|nr:iron ABC transporter permease [Siculibacillus lacustris]TBW40845.1 iron ABC transporter permease [Siculibacillus lacustris]